MTASLIVPDGMPLVWAARLRGCPLPERVAGGSLIFSLSEAAAPQGRSIYLIGGAPGVPERAGEELRRRYRGLRVAGAESPPLGFERDPLAIGAIRDRLTAAAPDIVYVGLGFPKQERLIAELAPACPAGLVHRLRCRHRLRGRDAAAAAPVDAADRARLALPADERAAPALPPLPGP